MSGEKDQIAGRAKQAVGDITDDDDVRREGENQEMAGKAKGKIDEAADKLKDAADSVKDKLNR